MKRRVSSSSSYSASIYYYYHFGFSSSIVLLLLVVLIPRSIEAFGSPALLNSRREQKWSRPIRTTSLPPCRRAKTTNYAIIYDGTGDDDGTYITGEEEEENDNKDENNLSSYSSEVENSIVKSIMEFSPTDDDTTIQQRLIRIACAFAPSPHTNIHPKDVLEVIILKVYPERIDLAIMLSDESSLVRVLVPVSFPEPPCDCNPIVYTTEDEVVNTKDNYEVTKDCILDHLATLDSISYEKIRNKEWENDNYEVVARQQQILNMLQQEPPNWLVTCDDENNILLLKEECNFLKDILNRDAYVSDLLRLFRSKYDETAEEVQRVCVSAIGPSGIYLRAYVIEKIVEEGEVIDDEDRIRQITIPFEEEIFSTNALRSKVLNIVESAGEETETESSTTEESPEETAEETREEILPPCFSIECDSTGVAHIIITTAEE